MREANLFEGGDDLLTRDRRRRRRAAFGLLVCLVALSQLAGSAAPAQASTAFEFHGRGWGHGVGMAQYGARALALAGYSERSILRHYYSGISFTFRDPENIRVLLESSRDVVVTSDSGFSAYRGSSRVASSSSSYPYLRAYATSDGYLVQRSPDHDGPWSTLTTVTGPVVFRPGSDPLQLVFDSGLVRYYRGVIEAYRTSSSQMHAVNDVNLEHYLRGVVPREMPSSWPTAAVRSQTVAARSYALNQKLRSRAKGRWYDICASTSCQVYAGAAQKPSPSGTKTGLEASATNQAIADTAGMAMTHPDETAPGRIINAVFSSSSGGKTENNTDGFGSSTQVPYLRSVSDRWSITSSSGNPYRSWTKQVAAGTVAAEVGLDRVDSVRVSERNVSGSVRTVQFIGVRDGQRATVSISGRSMRSRFGLRSAYVTRIFTPPFEDDDGLSFEPAIVALYREGITAGCGTARFCPGERVSRAQMAAFLARARSLASTSSDYFTDDDGLPFEPAINSLAAAGITGGCAAELFCPDRTVSRAHMAEFLVRAFDIPPSTTNHFTDDDGLPYEAAINALASAGLTGGCTPTTYCPGADVSRGQMAAFLARALGLV